MGQRGPTAALLPLLLLFVQQQQQQRVVFAEVLHCVAARDRCLGDPACAVLLDVIAKTCGDTYDGTVCRSFSLDTCQGALRAVWSHPSTFNGACVCGDDLDDSDCRHLRHSLSAHPCSQVPRPADPIEGGDDERMEDYPSCNFAYDLCTNNDKCKKIYDSFRRTCKVKNGLCATPSRIKCERAWAKAQLTPVYGCLCHEEADIEKCAKIYSLINRNPCVELLQSPTASGNGDETTGGGELSGEHHQHSHNRHHSSNLAPPLPSAEAVTSTAVRRPPGPPPPRFQQPQGGGANRTDPSSSHQLFSPVVSALHGEVVGLHVVRTHPNMVFSLPSSKGSSGGREPRVTGPPPDTLHSSGIKAKSTCQRAYHLCEADTGCKVLLGNMLQMCESNGAPCNRTECMGAVRDFYHLGNPATTRAVAFCICRYNDDACLVQQRRLHPPCAQRPEIEMPGCHEVAEQCRASQDCRPRMDKFVEACAVDRNTLQCQGLLDDCRTALIEILGTPLRTNCACAGNDFAMLYYCIEWQRMVWLNPCVVQAQKDFHESRPTPAPSPSPTRIRAPPDNTHRFVVSTATTTTTTTQPPPVMGGILEPSREREEESSEEENEVEDGMDPSLTTLITTSTDNSEYCVLKSEKADDIRIPVSQGQRIYDRDDPDCSTICICMKEFQLDCKHLGCSDKRLCNTTMAIYSHTSPTYIAFRGLCICYSGKFICVKPPKEKYDLNPGVYLFLGYSQHEEERIKDYTNFTISNVVHVLQRMIYNHKDTMCRLAVHNQFEENVIIQAYLEEFDDERVNNSVTPAMVLKEDVMCSPYLRNITHLINDEDAIIRNHIALSILKLADVEVHVKPYLGACTRCASACTWLIVLLLFVPLDPP